MNWADTEVEYSRHIRRVAAVDTVEEAFAFCLTGIEEEHICAPVIEVSPTMVYETTEDGTAMVGRMRFQAAVSGHWHADDINCDHDIDDE